MLIDTHCHLTHDRYGDDVEEVIQRAWSEGVGATISIASDLADAARIRHLVEALGPIGTGSSEAGWEGKLYRTVGIHPHQAGAAPEDLKERLHEEVALEPSPVAIGECGLDFHYDFSSPADQRRVFRVHLEAGAETGLPLVVHCREAEDEMTEFVQEAGRMGVAGVLHCFPGDLDLLEAAMKVGWLVSFTGLVTFPSFDGLDAVRRVPGDRYMLETDGPYMAPVPRRGRRNEPAYVPFIRDRVAQIREEPPLVVEQNTTATALRFFRLPGARLAEAG